MLETWRWRDGPRPTGATVVFDVDGVLSDATSRQHFLAGERKDWVGFFDACGEDLLIEEVERLLALLDSSLVIVLLTARPVRVRPQTLAWLHRYDLRWDLLVMRESGDYQAAREFKRRALGDLRGARLDVRLAFEDDRRNVDMFHAEGVPCVYIHSGYYD